MSSGGKQLDINTRERAVSTDVNRLQAFADWEQAEVWRRLVNMDGSVEQTGSYVDTFAQDTALIGTPAKGQVFDGLVVLPQTGSLNLLVSPGACIIDDPDGQPGSTDPNPPSADDSRAKICIDPGISVVGSLVIAAGGGGTRIDIIECQRSEEVIETDNRDIWDNSTGTFAPGNVNKVTAAQLLYRVRAGTPGGGLPVAIQGWMPLCVVSVPSSATSVDSMTFWDVRPLVKDRVYAPFEMVSVLNRPAEDGEYLVDDLTGMGAKPSFGVLEGQIGQWRAGGVISSFDINDSVNNWGRGFAPSAIGIWYLYAVFPGGLPRWVQYSPTAPRIPNGPKGVLTVTDTLPALNRLSLSNSVLPPSATGLGVAGPAAVLAAGHIQTDGTNFVPWGVVVSAGKSQSRTAGTLGEVAISPVASDGTTDSFRLLAQMYPRGAKSLTLKFTATITGGTANGSINIFQLVSILKPLLTNQIYTFNYGAKAAALNGSGGVSLEVVVDLPIPQRMLLAYGSDSLDFQINWAQTGGTKANGRVTVLGWRM